MSFPGRWTVHFNLEVNIGRKLFFHDVSRIDALTKKATEKINPEGRTYHQVPEGPHPRQG